MRKPLLRSLCTITLLSLSLPSLAAEFGGSLTTVNQRASNSTISPKNETTGRLDLNGEAELGSFGATKAQVIGQVRMGRGQGIGTSESGGTYTTVNATAAGGSDWKNPVLMQAYLRVEHALGAPDDDKGPSLTLNLGRIDPYVLFDGNNVSSDETASFMNLIFVHNPLLDTGGDVNPGKRGGTPGLRLAYTAASIEDRRVIVSVGAFGAGNNTDLGDAVNRGLAIGQLEYSGKTLGELEGGYRVYRWRNERGVLVDDSTEVRSGWGLSLDQQISSHVSLFSRYGKSLEGARTDSFDEGLTLGLTLKGLHWGRENDLVGFAGGWLKPASGSGREQVYELFYRWEPVEFLQLTPSVQWIRPASSVSNAINYNIIGLRAKLSF